MASRTNGVTRWYLYDGLGSTIAEVDDEGTITATRKYDVYGAVIDSTDSSDSEHKFCGSLGHTTDDNTDLIYMRARYYDPADHNRPRPISKDHRPIPYTLHSPLSTLHFNPPNP